MQSIVVRGLILPFVEFWRLSVSNGRLNSNLDSPLLFAIIVPPLSRFRKNTRRPSPPRRSNLIEFSPRNVTRDKTINKTIKVTDSNPIVGSIANYRITGDFWEKVLREGKRSEFNASIIDRSFLPSFLPSKNICRNRSLSSEKRKTENLIAQVPRRSEKSPAIFVIGHLCDHRERSNSTNSIS